MEKLRGPVGFGARRATIAGVPLAASDRDGDEILSEAGERHARAARWAARQWGNLTCRQLAAAGFSSAEIEGLARRHQLHRRHHGVYALGHVSPAPESAWAAGLLAAGRGSTLVGTAAAGLHGWVAPRAVVEVAAPTQRRGDETLVVRRLRLDERDVTRVRGLRVTTIPRTLLDLAARGWPIERLLHEAVASGAVALDDLRSYAGAAAGRKGARALRAALEKPHTRSAGERRLLARLGRLRLPLPDMNARIGRVRVDAHWPTLGLAVELDHDQSHGSA